METMEVSDPFASAAAQERAVEQIVAMLHQTHDYYYTTTVEWARRWPGEELWEAHLR